MSVADTKQDRQEGIRVFFSGATLAVFQNIIAILREKTFCQHRVCPSSQAPSKPPKSPYQHLKGVKNVGKT